MSAEGAPVIELRDVTQVYREGWRRSLTALRGLTLTIRRGEVYGFLGPNGAGKTTALHCLLGLLRPTEGSVRLFGEPVRLDRSVLRRVGYMPEDWTCYDFLTPVEMLRTFTDLYDLPRTRSKLRIGEALERVGLAEHGHRRLRRLSKGMRQRASLAQAIVAAPELLVLDEPTKELDPIGRKDVRALVREMAEEGSTVLMSSHLLSEVEMVCHRVGVLHQGRLVAEGSLDAILSGQESRMIRFKLPSDEATGAGPPAGSERETDGTWRLRARSQQEMYDGLAHLSRAGAEVISVQPETVRLEDYFIKVVTGP